MTGPDSMPTPDPTRTADPNPRPDATPAPDPVPAPHPPRARSLAQAARDGWALSGLVLRLVRHRPGLRRYLITGLAGILVVDVAVGAAEVSLRHQSTLPTQIGAGLLDAFVVVLASNLVAVGLAGLSNELLAGRPVLAATGWRLARRRLPQVCGWALLVVLVGIPYTTFTRWGIDQLAAVLLGFGGAVVSFFAIPAIALAGLGPLRAARRSVQLVARAWGTQVVGMVYVWLRPTLFLGVPGLAAVVAGVLLARNGFDLLGWSLGAAGVIAIAIAYFLVVAAESLLAVALYRYAEDGTVPPAFDREQLERVMRSPATLVVRAARRIEGERVRRLRARLVGDGE